MARTSDYERAYDTEVGGIESTREPVHFAGSTSVDIEAGATAVISLQPNMEIQVVRIVVSDAHAPSVELIDANVGPINLNAGDGPVPGDLFRSVSQVRINAAVPTLPNQPLRVRWRNKSATKITGFSFTIVGRVARSK